MSGTGLVLWKSQPDHDIMTMFPRRVRPKSREGDSTLRRRKRVKTFHTAEDQVIREFQDILGHLRSSDIGGPSVAQYDGGIEEENLAVVDDGNPPEDALPQANLKSVPHDPSLQALWIAREIKRLALYNERHDDRNRGPSLSTTSPVSPTFSLGARNSSLVDPEETPDSSLKSSRSSGRKKRQTTKVKDSCFVDHIGDQETPVFTKAKRNPMDGVRLLSALVSNKSVQHSLLYATSLGPGNFVKRCTFGTQFLQSMAADTLPPDPVPAAKLKHSLWRSRNHVPYFAALHILAGFSEVVDAIDIAFHGRLDFSTPLTRRERPLHDYALPSQISQCNDDLPVEVGPGNFYRNDALEYNQPPHSTRINLAHERPESNKEPMPASTSFPELAPKPKARANNLIQSQHKSSQRPAEPESDREGSHAEAVTAPTQFTPIVPSQSRKAISALNGAIAILDEMAYGALKFSFIPPPNGPPNSQYHTPYGPPGSNADLTPHMNHSSNRGQHVITGAVVPQQSLSGPPPSGPNAANDSEFRQGSYVLNGYSDGAHDMGQQILKGKDREKIQESVLVPSPFIEPRSKASKTAEAPNLTMSVGTHEDEDEEDDFAQIDSFLALAAGGDADSDDESDTDRTISREVTPSAQFSLDIAVDSIVRGITSELAMNQNWGHGLGFLPPQTHLYQINNAPRFIEGLTKCIDDARVSINCVISAEHSRAQEAFYDALIKRVTNPYNEGTVPQYSNVVYHNGRAYKAIPGPAHPMYQHQLPGPPAPPPSQFILPSQNNNLVMTPPVDPAYHALASRPTSSGQPPGNFGHFVPLQPAPPATSRQILPRRFSEDSNSDIRYIAPWQRGPSHNYVRAENDHASIHFRQPFRPLRRKRVAK